MKRVIRYFTPAEWSLWGCSVLLIIGGFCLSDRREYLSLTASLLGVTSLLLCAKGNPIGQGLIVLFSLLYGWISYSCAYYGEMLTYLCMTMPMAVVALVAWLRHPYQGKKSQVEVHRLARREWWEMTVLSVLVTVVFFFVLRLLGTAALLPSTVSITTSFAAVYLTARRSPYFAIAYAANDVVLLVLWALAANKDPSYGSMIFCFAAFLLNDIYGFVNWRRMERLQAAKQLPSAGYFS